MKSDQSYNISDIKQLYIKGRQLYMIVDGIEGSKHINLIPYLTSITKLNFIEKEIEQYLGIEDKQIAGEDP